MAGQRPLFLSRIPCSYTWSMGFPVPRPSHQAETPRVAWASLSLCRAMMSLSWPPCLKDAEASCLPLLLQVFAILCFEINAGNDGVQRIRAMLVPEFSGPWLSKPLLSLINISKWQSSIVGQRFIEQDSNLTSVYSATTHFSRYPQTLTRPYGLILTLDNYTTWDFSVALFRVPVSPRRSQQSHALDPGR